MGATNGWKMDDVIPGAEVVKRIHEVFPCEPVDPNYSGEVARRWRYQDGAGEFGVISSVRRPSAIWSRLPSLSAPMDSLFSPTLNMQATWPPILHGE